MNSSSTNSGKYIINFAVLIILLNLILIGFLFLVDAGLLNKKVENNNNVVVPPVSLPVSFPN